LIVTALLASKAFGTVALFSATTEVPLTYTLRSAGCVTNISLEPAVKLTKAPALLDDSTVVRENTLPEDVYVPIPTSQSPVTTLAIV
jgi:hypothetical protein